ncbi:MAG: MotA/TolQ/ExbB proton channel family protein [Rectinemataceae bacterium]
MLQIVASYSPVIVGVVAILVFFSVGSWAIIIHKLIQLASLKRSTREFTDLFWEVKEFGAIDARLAGIRPGPLSTLFREGYRETEHFLSRSEEAMGDGMLTADVGAIENISRSLRKVSSVEIAKIERDVGFLATAGATTPFIGLFGTVWGIMSAFRSIGQAGSTSLAIVAPGISEALITTAIGLAVAIPAVIGFNYVQGKIKLFVSEIDNFCYDFLNIVQKIFNSKR